MSLSTNCFNLHRNPAVLFVSAVVLALFLICCNPGAEAADKTSGSGARASAWAPCNSATCLKLSQSGWIYQNMPGKPEYLIWKNFQYRDGSGQGECWSIDHLGESIDYVGGRPQDRGMCSVCRGKLYLGQPTKGLPKAVAIPVHPSTYKKDNQVVLGRSWTKLYVNAAAPSVYAWYLQALPKSGWAVVDRTRAAVRGSNFLVTTNGAKSKWMSFAPGAGGRCELIMMSRSF